MSHRQLLTGTDVRELFTAVMPDEVLARLVEETKFQERQRKLEAARFVRSSAIAASAGSGGRQSKIMEVYFDSGARRVAQGGFYAWFNERFEDTMESVLRHSRFAPSSFCWYARETMVRPAETSSYFNRIENQTG